MVELKSLLTPAPLVVGYSISEYDVIFGVCGCCKVDVLNLVPHLKWTPYLSDEWLGLRTNAKRACAEKRLDYICVSK